MSEKLVIRGKRDDAKHDGMASHVRREQESANQLQAYQDGEDTVPRNILNRRANEALAHGFYLDGVYMYHGTPQPHSKK